MNGPTRQTKILFLAANPLDTTPILIDEEIRAIDAAWQRGKFRDSFVIEQHHAVRYNELQELLVRHQPRIVHFSGHGTNAGIVLSRDDGNSQLVSAEDLGSLFRVLKQDITCVVLNACYADAQAQAIAQHIDVVIGMPGAVQDKSSIEFAAEFYFAIASGLDVQTAFELGCLLITNPSSKRTLKMIALRNDPGKIAFMTAVNENNKEECEHLRKLLKQHIRNLQHLEEQRAIHAVGTVPLNLLNQIDYEKEEIVQIQSRLQIRQC